jgi:ABC-type polysaccharide/polyol phosphate transport system ATPase subunit
VTVGEPRVIFDGVWKKFRKGERHDSLRDLVPAAARRVFGRKQDAELREHEFWAVRDVSFQVQPGEVLGIIGPNGAGKSTVLKLLTRILKPTRGLTRVGGRVGSLIEVSAGFHPDLTGRENVFLQGAVSGMTRPEIRSRFDSIVDFAGVAAFIDTPVKRYSSGMNARLGFAIAAHLQPDVLLVDEVLAVGDLAFQQTAFSRLFKLKLDGTCLVLVSHQLDRLAAISTSALRLTNGECADYGEPSRVIGAYLVSAANVVRHTDDSRLRLIGAEVHPLGPLCPGASFAVSIRGVSLPGYQPTSQILGLKIVSASTAQVVFATGLDRLGMTPPPAGAFVLSVDLQANLGAGLYLLNTYVWDTRLEREVATAPQIVISVEGNDLSQGIVHMNPRATITV